MSEQDKFKEITKAADNALSTVSAMTKTLADNSIAINDLSELAYQLGYIKGLSYVPEDGDGEQ